MNKNGNFKKGKKRPFCGYRTLGHMWAGGAPIRGGPARVELLPILLEHRHSLAV